LISDRYSCYEDGKQKKNSGYCDSKILSNTDKQPEAKTFKECYNSAGLNLTDTTFCDNLYPLDNKNVGGSFRLLSCYETFGINITNEVMQEKCTSIHEKSMADEVDKFKDCLVNLGAPVTADHCILDPYNVDFEAETRKNILVSPNKYQTCMNKSRIYPEAYICKQIYDY
jgi:hypothetical protein